MKKEKKLFGFTKIYSEHKERVKELNCINQISEVLKRDWNIEKTLNAICNLLPEAWQYPRYCVARIKYDSLEYKSSRFRETRWIQKQPFKTVNGKEGALDIFYLKEFANADEGPFLEEERNLLKNVAIMVTSYLNLQAEKHEVATAYEGLKKLTFENRERVKELTCINQTVDVLKSKPSIEEMLQSVVLLLPDAWQYPEFTIARITFNNREYLAPREFTDSFKPTQWGQTQSFRTVEGKIGTIEVYYIKEFGNEDEGTFLKEERYLINNLASLLEAHLNSLSAQKILNKYEPPTRQLHRTQNDMSSRRMLQNFLNINNYERDIFHDLMPYKVKEILIVATLYDAFSIEKDGNFSEYILGQYYHLNLTSMPRITVASSFQESINQLYERQFDLIILMMGVDKTTPIELIRKIKEDPEFSYIPVFVLLNNNRDIALFNKENSAPSIDKLFVWNGDSKIFFAMVKNLEDMINVENDTTIGATRIILLVEDSVKYYSRYLPILYNSVMEQTKRIIDDVDSDDLFKVLRMRVRPKILLASNYEEAIQLYNRYKEYILCLISDVKFERNNVLDSAAGFRLVDYTRQIIRDIPIIIQSSEPENATKAYNQNCAFINKNSESLVQELRNFISLNLGFGDFIFKYPDGNEIAVARRLKEFENLLKIIPVESLEYHAVNNHFSLWLMARGEIEIATIIRPIKVTDFEKGADLRKYLLDLMAGNRVKKNKGKIVDFNEDAILNETNIANLEAGSLGGKGRGLAFINTLLYNFNLPKYINGINIRMPRTAIVGTDEFDTFLEINKLHDTVYGDTDIKDFRELFYKAHLSDDLVRKMREYLKIVSRPLAIRSSGLFEDSLMQPFAGIFSTYLLPNNHPNLENRLQQVLAAIKLVYASLFAKTARDYIKAINYKIEQEKMAVIIQEVVGSNYVNSKGRRFFFPHISGTAQSHNYYPVAHMKPEEGFAVIAVGLGQYVVKGERAYRFSPKYPKLDIVAPKTLFKSSQLHFYAVDMDKEEIHLLNDGEEAGLIKLEIYEAEKLDVLKHCASVYDPENDRIEPGLDAYGPRIVNFANILKYDYIPLAPALNQILDVLKEAMGSPVEIEFAVDLQKGQNGKASLYLLQIKPLVGSQQSFKLDFDKLDKDKVWLYSKSSLGNGKIESIQDVIYIDNNLFDKMKTPEMAQEIEQLNAKLGEEKRKYVLIGPGRWGTSDRYIGIPVSWPQISNAKIIVEIDFEDFPLDASLGSHFFHNVTSMNVGYFSVKNDASGSYINWDTLDNQKVISTTKYFKHIRFDKPLKILMDGRSQSAAIMM